MCVLDRARCAETNFTLRKVGRQVGCECDIETDVFSNFKHSNIFSHEKQLITEQKKSSICISLKPGMNLLPLSKFASYDRSLITNKKKN